MSELDRCKMALLAQADFDGELDASEAAEMEQHRAGCAECQAQYEEFARLRSALREQELYVPAPRLLHEFARSKIAPTAPPVYARQGQWRRSLFGFAAGAFAAAAVTFVIVAPGRSDLMDQIIDDHIRALQPGHLVDVPSSDRHTVKPWFDGRLDFAPPVKDLADEQFPLQGGRLDYLNGRAVAGLVYDHAKHVINLFVWSEPGSDSTPSAAARNGYNTVSWRQDNMMIWAVSDLERDQLEEFARLWREMP